MQVGDKTKQLVSVPAPTALESGPVVERFRANRALLLWIAATVAGSLLSGALNAATTSLIQDTAGLVAARPFTLVAGLILLGLLQWLVLRRYITGMRWLGWLLAMVLGGILASIITVVVMVFVIFTFEEMGETLGTTFSQLLLDFMRGAIRGAVIGVAQWLVLQRYLAKAAWWIPATVAAWGISAMIPTAASLRLGINLQLATLIDSVQSGLLVGIITGVVLVWLLRRPKASAVHRELPA